MSYCVKEDLLKLVSAEELAQLSDLENSGAVDENVVDASIETADALIDSYIAGRVSNVPLDSVPVIIKKISAKLALCELYSNRLNRVLPEGLGEMRKNALEILENLKNGKIKIMTDEGCVPGGAYWTDKTAESRIFTEKELRKY